MGSSGDWREFKMFSILGEESSWTRMVQSAKQVGLYRVGAPVEIDFVWQQHRPKSFNHGVKTGQVIEIRIGPWAVDRRP